MKVGVACDHGGYLLKGIVVDALEAEGAEVIDLGTDSEKSVNYAEYAYKALKLLKDGDCERIVLICGTGIGMSICANRIPGVRGTLCNDSFTARMSREHNDSNCLVLGARTTGPSVAEEIVHVWMKTGFEGGRHLERLETVESMTRKLLGD